MTTTTDTESREFRETDGTRRAERQLRELGMGDHFIAWSRVLLSYKCPRPTGACVCDKQAGISHSDGLDGDLQHAVRTLLRFAHGRYDHAAVARLRSGGGRDVLAGFVRACWIADGFSSLNVFDLDGTHTRTVISLGDLLDTGRSSMNSSPEVIPGFLRRGERLIVTGWEGSGKTYFRDQCAVMYAAGVHPLTLEPIEGGNVLIYDLEGTPEQRHERFERLVAAAEMFGNVDAETLRSRVSIRGSFETANRDRPADFRTEFGPCDPDLIVIGPLYMVSSGEDMATEEGARKIQQSIEQLIGWGARAATIIEHHSPHGEAKFRPRRPYGHSSWMRWPEFGIHLDASGTFTRWRGDRREVDWPTRFERGTEWPWMPVRTGDAPPSPHSNSVRVDLDSEIVRFLSAHLGEEFTTTALPKALRAYGIACRSDEVSKRAKTLAADGTISARSGPRASTLYSIPAESEEVDLGEESWNLI